MTERCRGVCFVGIGLLPRCRWAHDQRVARATRCCLAREKSCLFEYFGFVRNRQPVGATGTPTESLLDEYAEAWYRWARLHLNRHVLGHTEFSGRNQCFLG